MLTTDQLCELAGVSRRTLQSLIEAGAVVPTEKGAKGHGNSRGFTLMEALGVATAADWIRAGCDRSWCNAACAWVSRQNPGKLLVELAGGRTLLSLRPDGEGVLVAPSLGPHATREQRVMLANLNLAATYRKVFNRAHAAASAGERAELDKIRARVEGLAAVVAEGQGAGHEKG
jgi:hypothetical protein